jgi:hypothetical protein
MCSPPPLVFWEFAAFFVTVIAEDLPVVGDVVVHFVSKFGRETQEMRHFLVALGAI